MISCKKLLNDQTLVSSFFCGNDFDVAAKKNVNVALSLVLLHILAVPEEVTFFAPVPLVLVAPATICTFPLPALRSSLSSSSSEFQQKTFGFTRAHEIAENSVKRGLLKKAAANGVLFQLAGVTHFVSKPENKCSEENIS